MSGAHWRAPQRDAGYFALDGACQGRGLSLRSAMRYGEALRRGGDYWLIDRATSSQVFEADTLDELRKWLRISTEVRA